MKPKEIEEFKKLQFSLSEVNIILMTKGDNSTSKISYLYQLIKCSTLTDIQTLPPTFNIFICIPDAVGGSSVVSILSMLV